MNTVTIHLTKPDPDLFAQLTLPVAYPVPPGTRVHLPSRTVPGTGPYEISSYSPDLSKNPQAHGRLVLTRNPYFRQWSAAAQPAGFPNRIVVRTNYSQAQQVTAVEQGRADMTWDPPPPSDSTVLGQSFPLQLHQNPVRQTSYVWLDVRSAPFDNPLARRAFNYAVDRGALGHLGLAIDGDGVGGRSTCQLLPPDFPGYVPYCPYTVDPTPSQRWLAPDLAEAQALVHQSGTFGDQVALLARSTDGHRSRTSCGDSEPIWLTVRTERCPTTSTGDSLRASTPVLAGVGVWGAGCVAGLDLLRAAHRVSWTSRSGSMNMGVRSDARREHRFRALERDRQAGRRSPAVRGGDGWQGGRQRARHPDLQQFGLGLRRGASATVEQTPSGECLSISSGFAEGDS